MSPDALVFFLNALVNDDVQVFRDLLDEYPIMSKEIKKLTREELENMYSPVECTNHFYVTENKFGLVLENSSWIRALVSDCKTELNQLIFWGANSDPVQLATAIDIAYAFRKSKDHETPQKILTFLENMDEAIEASAKKHKKAPSSINSNLNPNLFKWVKEIMHGKSKSDMKIQVDVDEKNMREWNVEFPAEMFKEELVFEYLTDYGNYAKCASEAQSAFALVYKEWEKNQRSTSSCFQIGDASFYEACVDANGVLSQKNLSTDFVRPVQVQKSFYDELITWFKRNKKENPGVHIHLSFQPDFPISPPFVQVIRPRFQQWTGHVTIGGSMCTELLTASGWKPDISAMGLMLQLQNNLVEGEAKIDHSNVYDYTKAEALEAFKRVARDHGWKIPVYLE